MTKKDYQAIARAFWEHRPISAGRTGPRSDWQRAIDAIADVLAADSPRFDRATFVAACEDGNVTRRPKRKAGANRADHCSRHDAADETGAPYIVLGAREGEPLPPCVQAMRCYCAGHARGNPASVPCDTREGAR